MFTDEQRQRYREFLVVNQEPISQVAESFTGEDREKFRVFITETELLHEVGAGTISANLAIPTNIDKKVHDTDEMTDTDQKVKEIEIDSIEDTEDEERSGEQPIKFGDSIPKHNKVIRK